MTDNEFRPFLTEESRRPIRRIVWRVIGVSLFFLLLGLGALWFQYVIKDKPSVGLAAPSDLPPAAPIEQVAANRVRLFFTANGAMLSPEINEIGRANSPHERVQAVLKLLLRGPRSATLRSPLPRGTQARAIFVENSALTVDFSSALRNGLPQGPSAELLCVYSIVNTVLLNCANLKTVTILIDGRPVETLRGYLDLSGPLVENLALIAPEARGEAPTE